MRCHKQTSFNTQLVAWSNVGAYLQEKYRTECYASARLAPKETVTELLLATKRMLKSN